MRLFLNSSLRVALASNKINLIKATLTSIEKCEWRSA
jgi:hypothetical protein